MLTFTNPIPLAGTKDDTTLTELAPKGAIEIELEVPDATSLDFSVVFSEAKVKSEKSAPASLLTPPKFSPSNILPTVPYGEPEPVIFPSIEPLENTSAAALSQSSLPADLPQPMVQSSPNLITATKPLSHKSFPENTPAVTSKMVVSETAIVQSRNTATHFVPYKTEIRAPQALEALSLRPNAAKTEYFDESTLEPSKPNFLPAKNKLRAILGTEATPAQVQQTQPAERIAPHIEAKAETEIIGMVEEALKLPHAEVQDSKQKISATHPKTVAEEDNAFLKGRDTRRSLIDSGENNNRQPLGKPLSISTDVTSASPAPKVSEPPVRSLESKDRVDPNTAQLPNKPSAQQVTAPTVLPVEDEIKRLAPLPISSESKMSHEPLSNVQANSPVSQSTASAIQPPVIAQSLQVAIQVQIREAIQSSASNDIEIRLEPEELGKLRILMSPREGGMQVMILADRPETLELMRRNSGDLNEYLAEGGHENANIDFGSFSENERDENIPHSTQTAELQNDPDYVHVGHGLGDASLDIRL